MIHAFPVQIRKGSKAFEPNMVFTFFRFSWQSPTFSNKNISFRCTKIWTKILFTILILWSFFPEFQTSLLVDFGFDWKRSVGFNSIRFAPFRVGLDVQYRPDGQVGRHALSNGCPLANPKKSFAWKIAHEERSLFHAITFVIEPNHCRQRRRGARPRGQLISLTKRNVKSDLCLAGKMRNCKKN